MKSRHLRLTFIGLALGVLCALLIAPQTRWLVRLQALASLNLYHPFPSNETQSYTLTPAADARQKQSAVARHPQDFNLAYAQAVEGEDSAKITAQLRGLEPRFPNQSRFYAGLLRYAVQDIQWNRPEENRLYDLPQPESPPQVIPNDPRSLADFDREAEIGERLDPDNAYFPIIRSIGLFAAHRDSEGWAALERASKESQWREYVPEEVEARWRLHDLAFGDPGAFPRSTMAFTTLFPQYAKLRALARFLLAQAVQEEQAGHQEEGLKRREVILHYGDLMRARSTSLIGGLVGSAICAIATSRPGGAKPPKLVGLTAEQTAQRRLDAWSAYVTRLGHPELAARARASEAARRQVQTVASDDRIYSIVGPMFRLAAWWLAGLVTLANIGWVLVFGGLAFGLARLKRMREARPLSAAARAGFWTALLPGLALLALFISPPHQPGEMSLADEFSFPLTVLIFIPLAGFSLGAVLVPRLRSYILGGIVSAFVSLAAIIGFGALAAWQSHELGQLWWGIESLTGSSDNDASSQAARLALAAISLALSLATPLLLALIFSIAARVRHLPALVGIVQGFRTLALPLTCLLLLVWGGLLLGTVRQEQVVNQRLWHTVHDEGPYYAAQAGLPWPGVVQ